LEQKCQTVVFAADVAKIGATPYQSLINVINEAGDGDEIVLASDAEGGFDLGKSTGANAKNITINLNGKELDLLTPVGSINTRTNGLRVFYKYTIYNKQQRKLNIKR